MISNPSAKTGRHDTSGAIDHMPSYYYLVCVCAAGLSIWHSRVNQRIFYYMCILYRHHTKVMISFGQDYVIYNLTHDQMISDNVSKGKRLHYGDLPSKKWKG